MCLDVTDASAHHIGMTTRRVSYLKDAICTLFAILFSILMSAALAGFVSGCSVSGTWRASTELQGPASDAAEMWCKATDGAYCPVVDDMNGSPIELAPMSDFPEWMCGVHVRNTSVIGQVTSESIQIGDARGLYRQDGSPRCARMLPDGLWASTELSWTVVIAHELGHAAGLPDMPIPGAGEGMLMGSDLRVLAPTERDVEMIGE